MAKKKKVKKKTVRKSRIKKAGGGRSKGHGFERYCAKRLRPFYPDVKRHLENQFEEALGFDLDNTGPFKVQCKAKVNYSPLSAIDEVQTTRGDIPVLITKADNKKPIVALYLDDVIKLLKNPSLALKGVKEITVDDF